MKLLTVLGTRPEIIKMAPLLPKLDQLGLHTVVHSGQHYSFEMDGLFFDELELRKPDRTLEVGSRSPASQVGRIAEGVEMAILDDPPDWVIVHGDTNTTLGGALAAAKHRQDGIRLAHVEAGARSFNPVQPEELNRVLVDRMSDLLFSPTRDDADNLRNESIPDNRIVVTGNTVVESCIRMAAILDRDGRKSDQLHPPRSYALATLHRQETVDFPNHLRSVWKSLEQLAEQLPVVVPLHPRTRKRLSDAGVALESNGITIMEPVGYRRMIELVKNARFCLTDSGGVQEEAAILGVPTLVLREETEHRRYVEAGLHRVAGVSSEHILAEALQLLGNAEIERRRASVVAVDRDVSQRIIDELRAR